MTSINESKQHDTEGKLWNQNGDCQEQHEQELRGDQSDGTVPDEEAATNVTEDNNPAPDGGYGWVIVLGSLIIHTLIGGIERSAGTIFLKFDERFHQSAAATAWVTSIPAGIRLTLGPICSALCNKFSCRSVVIVGAVILGISTVISAFAPNIAFLYASFGIIGGLGRCFAYAPAVIIVGFYFNKRRGIGVGIATSGVGFGGFLFPTLIEVLFMQYGFMGAFIVLGGIMFNIVVCGAMFRPLWFHRKLMEYKIRRKESKLRCAEEKEKLHHPQLQHQKVHIPWHSVESIEINVVNLEHEDQVNPSNTVDRESSDDQPTSWIKKCLCNANNKKSEDTEKKKIFEFSLLKDIRFLCFCIAILLFTVAFQSAFVFIPPYAKQNKMNDLEGSYLIALAGGFDGVGRICSGFILDLKNVKKYRILIYNVNMVLVGSVSFIVPFLHTFTELAVLCSLYGLLVGTYISQKSVIIVDILGVEKLVNSFGLLICFQGIGMFLGPPIAGAMKDVDGVFDNGFYFGGGCMIFGALILAAANLNYRMQQKKSK